MSIGSRSDRGSTLRNPYDSEQQSTAAEWKQRTKPAKSRDDDLATNAHRLLERAERGSSGRSRIAVVRVAMTHAARSVVYEIGGYDGPVMPGSST